MGKSGGSQNDNQDKEKYQWSMGHQWETRGDRDILKKPKEVNGY